MLQVLVNSVVYGAQIAVVALGVSLSFAILRFANFAHIQLAVVGGYLTWVLFTLLGLPLIPSVLVAMAGTGGLAVLIDVLVFARLREASPEAKMIASWGVALLIRSLIGAAFGGSALYFDIPVAPLRWGGVRYTTFDLVVVGVTLAAMVLLHLAMRHTRLGTAIRALSSNIDLAATRGIPTGRIIRLMWFVAGAYAALGGALLGIGTLLLPNMDLMLLLPVFASAAMGGLGSVQGAVAGAFTLSLAQNAVIAIDFGALLGARPWYVPSQFRDFVAVACLVLVLLVRPHRHPTAAARA